MGINMGTVTLAARGLQVVLSIVVLGLMAYVATWWGSHWRQVSPMEINFLVFSPVWTLIVLIPLIVVPLKFPHLATSPMHKYALAAIEGVTMLFWFGGFIALAVFLSDRICFGMVCSIAKAGTAMAALNWAVFAGTTVLAVLNAFKRGNSAPSQNPKVEMHQGV